MTLPTVMDDSLPRAPDAASRPRTYGQYCPLAKTLDLLGQRWTPLIIRDLLLGPKRYTDLLERLSGMGTGLLANRLRLLESEGLVARRALGPPARATAYELTGDGLAVAEALAPLALWGTRSRLVAHPRGDTVRGEWHLLALVGALTASPAVGGRYVFEIRVEPGAVFIGLDPDGCSLVAPVAYPDARLTIDEEAVVDMVSGAAAYQDLLEAGRLRIEGAEDAVDVLVTTVVDPLQRFRGEKC